MSTLQNPSSGGILTTMHVSVPLAGVILFLIMTGVFFALFRSGVLDLQLRETRKALPLAAFFGLGTSLVLTCLLAGSMTAGTIFALIYMGAGTPLAAYLWHAGIMTRKAAMPAAALGALAGFVFLAPIMPMELGGIINVLTGVSVITAGVIGILAVIAMTLVVGRTFCGNICPVGSVQELVHTVPVMKARIQRTALLEIFRLATFLATVIAAINLVDLMAVTGFYDLFSLTISAGLVTAAVILAVSAFVYRPVCRIICPFGVIFGLFSEFSLFRLRRTPGCIRCGKCENTCPAFTAGPDAPKRECYLCGRCMEVCPVKTGIAYCR